MFCLQLFEGMKAYRGIDNKIRLFRPDKNAQRMHRTAKRSVLPVSFVFGAFGEIYAQSWIQYAYFVHFYVFVSTEFRRARVSGLCTQTRARRSGMGAVLDHKHPLHPTDLHRNWPNPRRRCLLKSSALRYYWTSGALLRKRVQTGHSPGWPHSRQSLEGRIGSLQDGQVRLSSFIFKSYSKLVMKCAYFSATTHRPSTCQQKRLRSTAVSRCCGCTEKRKSGQRSEPWTSSCFGRTNREVRVLTHHEPCTISHHEIFYIFL